MAQVVHEDAGVTIRRELKLDADADMNDPQVQARLLALLRERHAVMELLAGMNRDLDFLTRKITILRHNIGAVHTSLAWRLGWGLVCVRAKLLRKPVPGSALSACEPVFDAIEHWKLTRD